MDAGRSPSGKKGAGHLGAGELWGGGEAVSFPIDQAISHMDGELFELNRKRKGMRNNMFDA